MSSPFARATKTVPIPFDPPNEVTVQQLTGKQLVKAQKAFFNELVAEVQLRGGARVQKDIQLLFEKDKDASAEIAEQVKKVQADPLNGYDKYSLCYSGIKAWTYPESLERVTVVEADGRTVVVAVPAIDELSDEALDFFATEILRLTKPSLFLEVEDAKAAQKETHADSLLSVR